MKQTTLKLLTLMLFMLATVMAFITSGHAQKSQAAATFAHPVAGVGDPAILEESSIYNLLSPRNLAQQQGDKPVEQTRKNIQVLKGLPDSRLFPVMNFIGDSLGVRCTYCHVYNGGDKWEWESDAKPEKQTAREMMRMTLAINKDSFSGNQGVTCYSCHRGQTHVVGMPPFPLPPRESFLEDAPKPDTGLPTADQVFDKYIQAIGGKSAFDKLKTRVWKGTYITSNGTSLPYEIQQAAPNKFLSTLTTPKQGVFLTAFNGVSGWQQNLRGVHELSGSDLAQLKNFAGFFGGVNIKEQFTNLRVVRKEKVGEREAYLVRAVSVDGNNERLYFDTQTGLLLRRIVVEKTMILPIPEQTDFEDYREVDGLKLPFTIQVYNIDSAYTATRKFTEVKHNVPVDDAKFNMPAQKQ
jgi:hypothetical protein